MAAHEPFPWESEGETLALETPEQTVIELPLAPFGSRLVAALLDQLILLLVFLGLALFAILAGALGGVSRDSDTVGFAVAVAIVLWFLISTLAPAWWEIRGDGRTPGKRKLKLRTVMAGGQGLTVSAAVLRNLARLVDQIPLLWLIPALSPGKRRIGDVLAGTLVVSEERPDAWRRKRDWLGAIGPSYAGLDERRFFFGTDVLAKLRPEDLDLIEYLGDRLPSLKASKQLRLLRECAQQYTERLGLAAEQERIQAAPDRFLRELGLFLRDRYRDRAF
jgi:uncharacterized RDD family membrane protein YckC